MNNIKYLKSWIIFFIVSLIGGFLAGAAIGGILGAIIAVMNAGDPEVINNYISLFEIAGFLAALPVSFLCYKWTISKYILPQLAKEKDNSQ